MRTAARWFVVVTVALHGAIHLLGAAEGLGWAEVGSLTEPIGRPMGLLWAVAAALLLGTAAGVALHAESWWLTGAAGVVASQLAIAGSWGDARVGTAANAALLPVVAYGAATLGPWSARARLRRAVAEADALLPPVGVVTEADVAALPPPVAEYVFRSGAVGQPRVANFRAHIHGRIRGGPHDPWMPFTGEQVNTFAPDYRRVLYMDATMKGVPVDVLHRYVGPSATMRVTALGLVPIVEAAGPEMDRAETVTLFNDLCILAPGALVDAPVTWEQLDDHRVRGTFSHGAHTVAAVLVFDHEHRLVDFVSDDRLRASRDGSHFVRQRWSTPVGGYHTVDDREFATVGEGHWHAPDPEGEFTYLDFHVDDLAYNV